MSASQADAKARTLALVSTVGTAVFVVLVAVMPIVKEAYSPVGDAISDGARGEYGYLQTAAFLALGVGSLSLGWALTRTLGGRAARVGSTLVGLWGMGILIAAIFPTDLSDEPDTTAGAIHNMVSLLSFVLVLIAIFTLTASFRRAAAWRPFWPLSLALGMVALVALFVSGAAQEASWWGVAQRVFVGLVVLWLLITSIRLRGERWARAV